jgi:gamma-glutamyltranspeptidase/glutathione hydrolase
VGREDEEAAWLQRLGALAEVAHAEDFQEQGLKDIPPLGPLPVSVPGCVDGWFALHGNSASCRWTRCCARDRLREGRLPGLRPDRLLLGPVGAAALAVPRLQGAVHDRRARPKAGEIWKNPNLAHTLEAIAKGGRDAFYKGEIAKTIDAYFKANKGFLSYDDLAGHQGEWVEPVSTNYRGYDVWELPPNSQGIATLQILNILEGYDLKSMGFGSPGHVHLFVEAKKLAFEDRAKYYADPAFAKTPVSWLISKDYAAERRKLIDMRHAAKKVEPGRQQLNQATRSTSPPRTSGATWSR